MTKTNNFIVLGYFLLPIILFGFYPEPILNTTEVSIRDFLEEYNSNIISIVNK